MPLHLHAEVIAHTKNGSLKFEGELYNFPASFFLIADEPGNPGTPLDKHPYPETWIVRSGAARFTAGVPNLTPPQATSMSSKPKLPTNIAMAAIQS